ncbi:MAG: hypothetical protein GEV11_20770 [Streptosporangiales bacterium]|nr:hypothetical protein [Streptosporangiales bacterium]
MTAAVLLLAEVPATGYLGGVAAERVPMRAEGGDVPASALIDHIAMRLGEGRPVIALYPAWAGKRPGQVIRMARGILETDRIAGIGLDLPPLALSLIADQLAYLAPYVPAGVVAGLAVALPEQILAGAWLKSVTGLEHLPTSMGDHVRSYMLGGGGFLATAAPIQEVHRYGGADKLQPLPFRPADPVQVLAVQEEGDTGWFNGTLMPAVQPAVVNFAQLQPMSSDYWGTKKYVEFIAFSGHPQALSYAANALRVRPCPWCHEPVAQAACAFCGMVRRRTTQPAPAAQPAAGPAPQEQGQDPRALRGRPPAAGGPAQGMPPQRVGTPQAPQPAWPQQLRPEQQGMPGPYPQPQPQQGMPPQQPGPYPQPQQGMPPGPYQQGAPPYPQRGPGTPPQGTPQQPGPGTPPQGMAQQPGPYQQGPGTPPQGMQPMPQGHPGTPPHGQQPPAPYPVPQEPYADQGAPTGYQQAQYPAPGHPSGPQYPATGTQYPMTGPQTPAPTGDSAKRGLPPRRPPGPTADSPASEAHGPPPGGPAGTAPSPAGEHEPDPADPPRNGVL